MDWVMHPFKCKKNLEIKSIFQIFKGRSLKQIKPTFFKDESPT